MTCIWLGAKNICSTGIGAKRRFICPETLIEFSPTVMATGKFNAMATPGLRMSLQLNRRLFKSRVKSAEIRELNCKSMDGMDVFGNRTATATTRSRPKVR